MAYLVEVVLLSTNAINFSESHYCPSLSIDHVKYQISRRCHGLIHVISLRKGNWVSFSGQLTEATIKRRKCLCSFLIMSLIQVDARCTSIVPSKARCQTLSSKPIDPPRL